MPFLPYDELLAAWIDATSGKERVQNSSNVTRSASKAAKWHGQGWQVDEHGFPLTNWTVEECSSYKPECRHTYNDTFVSWDTLVGLDSISEEVPLVDRWNVSTHELKRVLGVSNADILTFKDVMPYQFVFTDLLDEPDMLIANDTTDDRWQHRVSLLALRRADQRVVLFGSLFGTGRVQLRDGDILDEWRRELSQSLAFNNKWLLMSAEAIAKTLSQQRSYLGIHARVGDGAFGRHARQNMEALWLGLTSRMKVSASTQMRLLASSLHASDSLDRPSKRSWIRHLSLGRSFPLRRIKRFGERDANQDGARESSSVQCRSELHVEPQLRAFNEPLYIATDSPHPTRDPALAIFFDTFPCTYILSDFDRPSGLVPASPLQGLVRMKSLVNEQDGIELGRLFVPFVDAIVAAKARITVGTAKSTFSGALHDAYDSNHSTRF
ncbi:hypothetical protein ACM66B_000831 [Microbotryomycetes sp. NB124-2]